MDCHGLLVCLAPFIHLVVGANFVSSPLVTGYRYILQTEGIYHKQEARLC